MKHAFSDYRPQWISGIGGTTFHVDDERNDIYLHIGQTGYRTVSANKKVKMQKAGFFI